MERGKPLEDEDAADLGDEDELVERDPAHRVVVDRLAPLVPVLERPPIVYNIPGGVEVKVIWDKFSHVPGDQRGFVYCKLHDGCRLYRFVKHAPSHEACACWLIDWG